LPREIADMTKVNVIVRLQKRATRNVYGKKFYNHYLTVPNSLVNALGLEPGAAFEAIVAQDGRIIYIPVRGSEGRLGTRRRRTVDPRAE
jgi:hypothetical protein